MDTMPTNDFVVDYINAWSVTDTDERLRLIEKVYDNSATFYAHEAGDKNTICNGQDEIFKNISQVNERLTQGKGLLTESTGHSVNNDLLKVTWKMFTIEGTVAMTGMNILVRNESGKIVKDYIFIG